MITKEWSKIMSDRGCNTIEWPDEYIKGSSI
jgi:hypothetical protein